MFLAIWWGILSLSILLLFIITFASIEALNLKGFTSDLILKVFLTVCGIFILSFAIFLATSLITIKAFLFSVFSVLLLMIIFTLKYKNGFIRHLTVMLFICLYIILPLCLVPFLAYNSASEDYNPYLILSILLIIWVYDSFAYLSGVIFGKHKIYPSISPKKSWEGFIGGIVFAFLAAYLISNFNHGYTLNQWFIISLIIAVAGTVGDFFESFLKRKAGVKDSGNLLPGHGGILDRFDSFLFAVPVVFIFVKFII